MQNVLGETQEMGHNLRTFRRTEADAAQVRRALDILADVIVRIWTSRAMYHGSLATYRNLRLGGA
jgi:hypothetical protein